MVVICIRDIPRQVICIRVKLWPLCKTQRPAMFPPQEWVPLQLPTCNYAVPTTTLFIVELFMVELMHFFLNFIPRFGIKTSFVDITKMDKVEAAITTETKVLYCETVSNPLLEIADIGSLSIIARMHNLKLVVDNTFSPLSVSPAKLGPILSSTS